MMSTLVYLTETVDYFRTDFISHTKDPLVCNSLQFLVHVHLCHLLFCTLLHVYHILQYFSNIIQIFLDSCCVQLMAVAFIVHFITHIAAVTIDPADASVRAKQSYSSPLPVFDRTKQPHVIQDLRCYLCDVRVYVYKAVVWHVILLLIEI